MFKEDRKFKLKQQTLKREFFKHCGHFTHCDFGKLAQHLIGATPLWRLLYPKVSVARTRYLAPSNYSHADWVERRKRNAIFNKMRAFQKNESKKVDILFGHIPNLPSTIKDKEHMNIEVCSRMHILTKTDGIYRT